MLLQFPLRCCLLSVLSLFLTGITASQGQVFENYYPRKTFDQSSQGLLTYLQKQADFRAQETPPPYRNEINALYRKTNKLLSLYIKNKSIINDDSLQRFVDAVFDRLVKNNTINHKPTKILILKSAATNAVSFPEGTILVYIGLLSKITNESELAFTLAHEIAHYELEHSRKHFIEVKKIEQKRKNAQYSQQRLYNKEFPNSYLFNFDSLRAHPEIEMRQTKLYAMIDNFDLPIDYQDQEFVDGCIRLAKFEAVECAFENKQYDQCLYLALKLNSTQPRNRYLISTICKILVNISLKKERWLIVPVKTTGYNEELRLVNDFLNTIQSSDLAELAFHFLKHNFDESCKEHYYILWKVSALTRRNDIKKDTKEIYRKKFGKDYYFNLMN